MSMISAIIGSVGGLPPKTAAWGGITFDPINEGQQQTATVDFANWDSSTVYWELVEAGSSTRLDSRVVGGQAYGTISPGNGNSTQTINFTFSADATTEGTTYYVVRIGSTFGGNEYINQGNFTIRDTSQTPALVLDLDPGTYNGSFPTVWPDQSSSGFNAGIYNYNTSGEAGGTFVWDGSTTQAEVPGLHYSTYGTVTLSTWIKPTTVTGTTQTLIAKELCYKLRINSDGTLTMGTAKGYSPWEVTATATAGLVTTSTWSNVVATVDGDYTRIYVNGVKVTETTGNIIGANSNPFDIGMYQTTGSPSDFFGGLMGEVKVWNYALTEADVIAQYNSTAARYGQTAVPMSLDFLGTGNPYLLVQNTQSDWNLGTTYTIEFWSKGGNASSGTIRTVASQGPGNGIDVGYAYTHLLYRNTEPAYPEPTPGAWTHVAYVGEGDGYIKLYYNGVYQTYFAAGGLIDGGSDLDIGRRAGVNGQGFYGKLAMIRISSTAKYTSRFNPSVSYGVEGDTRLLLGNTPTVDGTGNHPISNSDVSVSTDFPSAPTPKLVSGTALGFNGTDNRYVVVADNLADWNLGDNWTIEWWHNIPTSANGYHSILCQDANIAPYTGIDVFVNNNRIKMFNGYLFIEETPATRNQWNHIAIQKDGNEVRAYINGVQQPVYGGNPGTIAPSSPLNLVIGSRTPDGGTNFYGQYFVGQLANIRISNIARYSGTFTPPLTVEYDVNTKLSLDGSVGSSGMLVDELTRHTITNNGATIDTIS